MSARLTPTTVAEREIARLQERIERHQLEIQNLAIEQGRWQAVLHAMRTDDNHDETPEF